MPTTLLTLLLDAKLTSWLACVPEQNREFD